MVVPAVPVAAVDGRQSLSFVRFTYSNYSEPYKRRGIASGSALPHRHAIDDDAGAAFLPFFYFEIVDYGIELSGHLF